VRNIVNMATIAVVDAQIKTRIATEEEIRRSPWWKRLKRTNKVEP
jgi:malate dehydrogenase (oxaloacetate-decarboxylating)(NADP+)